MITNLKTVKISLILLILLISSFSVSVINPETKMVDTAEAALPKLIMFNSYMDFEYDSSVLNEPLAIDVSVSMQITVKFWTDIPKFFQSIPFPLNYLILYGQSVGPMQKIHLEIEDTPEWANIYISSPDVLTDIPFEGEYKYVTTNLVVSPRIEAPAVSSQIQITGSCEEIGRLKSSSHQETIDFTPSFIPTMEITIDNPMRTVGPHETVNFDVHVKNNGNKITRVTPTLVNRYEEWTQTLNPPQIEIHPDSESTFTFSLVSPYNFGWHNEYKSFEIKFKSEVYPYRPGAANNTQSIFLTVNNLGFSLPGFEAFTLLVAAMCITYIVRKKKIKP